MNPLLWPLLAVVAMLLAVLGGVVLMRARRVKEEPIIHFPCPHCKRKLRCRASQAGHTGQCPRCGKSFTFPRQ